MTVVPDDVTTLSDVIRTFSANHSVVLTTGGIGPTHDDVTYEALALAFNDTLHYHPMIVEISKQFFKTNDEKHPSMKLAFIPLSSKLTYGVDPVTGQKSLYPNVSVRNVFIFPGVPHLCERMFKMTSDQLFPVVGHFFTERVYLNANESDATSALNEAVKKFPKVVFGSYPVFFHSYYSVKITLESLEKAQVEQAVEFLKANLPGVLNYDSDCFKNKSRKVHDLSLDNPLLSELLKKMKDIVKSNNPDDLYLYFDGGKNSVLLLHLLSIIFDESKNHLNLIYVERNKKVSQFVKKAASNYKANLVNLSDVNFRRFLRSDPDIKLIKGTRASDPDFKKISKYFPEFETVNPLLDWSYFDVWGVIRGLYLPYCDLYDRGYSSLNAPVNEKLLTTGPRKDLTYYKSAYLLENAKFE